MGHNPLRYVFAGLIDLKVLVIWAVGLIGYALGVVIFKYQARQAKAMLASLLEGKELTRV